MGRIHRWVTQAIDLRVEDVRNRRDNIAVLKYEREQALAEDKARTEKREAALEEKIAVSSVTGFPIDVTDPLLIFVLNS